MNTEEKRMLNELHELLARTHELVCAEPVSPDMAEKVKIALQGALEGVRWVLEMYGWPKPTMREPDLETIEEWLWEEGCCEASDGCVVEQDGTCPHGHPSWLRRLGWI